MSNWLSKKKLQAKCLLFVLSFRVAFWLVSFNRLNKFAEKHFFSFDRNPERDWEYIDTVASYVEESGKYVPDATCLVRALAAKSILGLRGQSSELKIGVRKKDGERMIAAHAWVEVDEKIILGKHPDHESYVILESFESAV